MCDLFICNIWDHVLPKLRTWFFFVTFGRPQRGLRELMDGADVEDIVFLLPRCLAHHHHHQSTRELYGDQESSGKEWLWYSNSSAKQTQRPTPKVAASERSSGGCIETVAGFSQRSFSSWLGLSKPVVVTHWGANKRRRTEVAAESAQLVLTVSAL